MFHGVTALMARSLRMDARGLQTHLYRLVFVCLIYLMMFIAQVQSLTIGAPGLGFFTSVTGLNLVFLTLGAIAFFATAITEEKEENTIGLLMMAGLNPLGILLGKGTARMLQALLLIAVQFPFTLLAITLGGVTIEQVLASYASLLAYTVLLSNFALLASVVCARSGSAMFLTFVLLLLYELASPIVLMIDALLKRCGVYFPLDRLGDWLLTTSTWNRPMAITATGYSDPIIGVHVFACLVAGTAAFLLAWLLFPIFALQDASPAASRGLLLRRRRAVRGLSAGRAWKNAFVWKDFQFIAGGLPQAVLKVLGYGALLGLIALVTSFEPSGVGWSEIVQFHLSFMAGFVILEASILASRLFSDEVREQTLVSLLTLPRSIGYIAYSKTCGCLLGLIPGLVWVMVDALVLLPDGPGQALTLVSHPTFWCGTLVVTVFLHLVVILSLFLKWGALPVAFLVTLMSNYCCPLILFGWIIAGSTPNDAHLLVNLILWTLIAVCCFVFQMVISARLFEIGSK